MPSSQISTLRKTVALLTAAAIFTSCSGGPSFDTLFDPSPEAEGTGIVGVGLVRAVVIIAKYKATERQRQIAEQNGRRAYARLVSQPALAPRKKTAPSKPHKIAIEKPAGRKPATKSNKPGESARQEVAVTQSSREAEPEPTPKKRAARKKPAPRYIAVDTERDARSKGAKSVMIWDTQSQQIVGNDVYDVEAAPRVGAIARFETYSAQYVGSGEGY